jgi:hypothetical protein
MNRKIALAVLSFLFCSVTVFAQVQFSNLTFEEALQKAKTQNKIVLAYLESPDCAQCNEVAMQGFANQVYSRSVNDNCIAIKIKSTSADFKKLDSIYNIGSALGCLFVTADGMFLNRVASTSSFYISNMEQLDKALNRKDNPDKEFIQLQNDYNNGIRSFDQLYKLVAKKNAWDLEHDQLTEEMISLAPKDSATSLTFIQFVVEQAPVFDSKAYRYMYKDSRNFSDAWYLFTQQKRVLLNNKMNYKSKQKAIKAKDAVYAEKVARYTSRTYSEQTAARKSYEKNMIDFYKGINDTSNYLSASAKYYDQYLMTVSVDSVLRADSIRLKETFAATTPEKMPPSASGAVMMSSIKFAPSTQYYTNDLNSAAWAIYTYTHDDYYNAKAVSWAKRATEFYDNPPSLDTYARLLYRTGKKEEAVRVEEKAIQIAKKTRYPTTEYEEILQKMKSGSATIDKY